MGFRKAQVQPEIVVSFGVEVQDDRTGETKIESVTHTFTRPTIKQREAYQDVVHSFVGGKHKLRLTKANLLLWDACVVKVSGYDDLPQGDWKTYFLADDIGREHANAAVRILMDRTTEVEEELTKN